jgi:hypothetical protein
MCILDFTVFGVLPVSPPCFFLMAFLGDAQSILFSTYLGSISKSVLEAAATGASAISTATAANQQHKAPPPGPQVVIGVVELENGQFDLETGSTAGWLPVLSLIVAASMTTIASVVARRAYLQVLCDIKLDQAAAVRKLKRERRRSTTHAHSTPIRIGGGLGSDSAVATGAGGLAHGSSPRVSTEKDLW